MTKKTAKKKTPIPRAFVHELLQPPAEWIKKYGNDETSILAFNIKKNQETLHKLREMINAL